MHNGIVTTCDVSHDGKYVVSGSDLDSAVSIWDARDGQLIKKLLGTEFCICYILYVQPKDCSSKKFLNINAHGMKYRALSTIIAR